MSTSPTLARLAFLLGTNTYETLAVTHSIFAQALFMDYRNGMYNLCVRGDVITWTQQRIVNLVRQADEAAERARQVRPNLDGLKGMPWTAIGRPQNTTDWPDEWHAARFVWKLDWWLDTYSSGLSWPRDTSDRVLEVIRCVAVLQYLHEIYLLWPNRMRAPGSADLLCWCFDNMPSEAGDGEKCLQLFYQNPALPLITRFDRMIRGIGIEHDIRVAYFLDLFIETFGRSPERLEDRSARSNEVSGHQSAQSDEGWQEL